MQKGQGSLEYLLILAAILAIVVVVVLIANVLLGTPREANLVNQDKYNFATNGWEVRGYDKPFNPTAPSTRPNSFVHDEIEYFYGGEPTGGERPIGVIQGGGGETYPIFVNDEGEFLIQTEEPVLETCTDGVMNQDETDIDCGGAICSPCADGQSCSIDSDCLSGFCDAGVCTSVVLPDSISISVREYVPKNCPTPVVVTLTSSGSPVEGFEVQFDSGAGSMTPPLATTNTSGMAESLFEHNSDSITWVNATADVLEDPKTVNVGTQLLKEITDECSSCYLRPITLDGDYIYWSHENDGSAPLRRMHKDTLVVDTLATKGVSCEEPDCIDVDGDYVYWSTGGWDAKSIWRTHKTTGTTTALDSGLKSTGVVQVDGAYVYYMDVSRGNLQTPKYLKRTLKDGSGSPEIITGVHKSALDMKVSNGYAYWSEDIVGYNPGILQRIPIGGGAKEQLTPSTYGRIMSIVADDDPNGYVYFSVQENGFYSGDPKCRIDKVDKVTKTKTVYLDGVCPWVLKLDPYTQLPRVNTGFDYAIDLDFIYHTTSSASGPEEFYKTPREC